MGLTKTRDQFTSKVNDLVARFREVDEEFFEELEELIFKLMLDSKRLWNLSMN